MPWHKWMLPLCPALLLFGQVWAGPDATTQGLTGLQLDRAWVRAMPPGQTRTAAYLRVTNTADVALTITGARADIAGRTEMHRTLEVDGMMRMEPVPRLPLAAGASADFAPGGLHLMLLDLERMPPVGESVSLCLEQADRPAACIVAPVLRDGGGDPAGGHQHH